MTAYPKPQTGLMIAPVTLRSFGETYREALDRLAGEMLARTIREHAGELDKAAAELGLTLDELEAERERLAL